MNNKLYRVTEIYPDGSRLVVFWVSRPRLGNFVFGEKVYIISEISGDEKIIWLEEFKYD